MEIEKELIKEITKSVLREIENKKKKAVYHNTKLLMENYNDLKKHIANTVYDVDGLMEDEIIDITGEEADELYIYSIKKSKIKTLIMMKHIDVALGLIKKEAKGKEELQYKVFYNYYIKGMSYIEIADKMNISESTLKRYIKEVMNKLSIYMFGVEALKIT